ncbi:MAG: Xaa-Pro peptidase family protein [Pseudomonadota bacterium]
MTIQKSPNPFREDEYLARLEKSKKAMEEKGVDVFLVTCPSNIFYLSGYGADSAYVSQAIIIDLEDKYPKLCVRRQDTPAGYYMSFMPNDNVTGYPESFIGDPEVDGYDFMVDTYGSLQKAKRVGVEFGSVSASTLAKLQKRLPNATFVDMSEVVDWHRLVKSPAEIEIQHQAGVMTDLAFQTGLEAFAKPNMRECDVAAEISAALIRGTPEFGGTQHDPVLIPGGLQSGTSHIPWTEQKIQKGKHYNMEFGAARHRYSVGLMRTAVIEKPSDKLSDLYKYMIEGCNNALEVIKPGVTCGEIARSYADTIAKGGYEKDSRCGYPIGIDWLETTLSLRTDSQDRVSENMVIHLMLGTWIKDDFGAVISETFRVTSDGYEVFSKLPRELLIV